MPEQSMPEVKAPKPRLLFVEDEATLREHLAERLSDEYVVDTAGNGNDALLAVMRAKPALVVTDIVMPDMDGVELLKTLRQSPSTRSIPVLLISGRAPEAQRIEGFEEGADGFLAKPYTERELRALIRSMVRSAQLRTEAAGRNSRAGDLQRALTELHVREEQLRENQRHLATEVEAMRRLHELVNRLLACKELQTALEEVLDAAIALLDADMGTIQLFDSRTRKLEMVAHRGFREDFLEYFRGVGADPSAVCARAAQHGQLGIVEDVQTDLDFAPHSGVAAAAGFRAFQSTPIMSRKGVVLGVLSTHFRRPHRPSERALQMVDLYGRQGAEFLEHMRVEASFKEADRRKSEFLAVLTHELRNPLVPISNGLRTLRLRAPADELLQRTVTMMDRQMSHLVRLVDDLLDISRIARGSVELKREKILLTDVLASAVEAARPRIDAHEHQLIMDVHSAVPVVIEGDRHRLVQVFSNLLCNSAKYTDRGGIITLTLHCQGSDVVVSVRDTGIGIPPHELEQIFEMFSQVATADARSEGGLGIGLALVRTLTQLHGGSVSASSQGSGTGSVFTVRLPVVQETLTTAGTLR